MFCEEYEAKKYEAMIGEAMQALCRECSPISPRMACLVALPVSCLRKENTVGVGSWANTA